MRKLVVLAGFFSLAAACTDQKLPLAPTAIAVPTPPVPIPPLPTTVPGVLAISMPIDAADLATTAFGLAPFGHHAGDHAEDGHAGWDIEYRVGGTVRAAAAGTVESVFADAATGRFEVRLEHVVGSHHYRTVYANLLSVSGDIAPQAIVRAGQTIGAASGLVHFQLDDFEYYREMSHPNAVSPEPFLSAEGSALFDRIWTTAAFASELVEPFITNPRALSFPASRTWTRAGGDGPAGIRFTRRTARSAEYDYVLLAESGTVIETGTVVLSTTARPSSIDLISPLAAPRLGIYDIVSNELRMVLGQPGANRPSSLTDASIYRTSR
jgi:hypothetical protein